jgi:hypothetical protein
MHFALACKAIGTGSCRLKTSRSTLRYRPYCACSPVSAMRMLEEFVDLESGDCMIQNGANSAVGRAVIQFAHAQGIGSTHVPFGVSSVCTPDCTLVARCQEHHRFSCLFLASRH